MKKLLFLAMTVGLFGTMASTTSFAQTTKVYGEKFKAKNVQTPEQVAKQLESTDAVKDVVVKGTVTSVCQMAGCWIKMKNEGGEDFFVKFKGEDFHFPKDASGRMAMVRGTAKRTVTSVEQLRHFAEDEGKSESEINAITEPKEELRIDASGAVLM